MQPRRLDLEPHAACFDLMGSRAARVIGLRHARAEFPAQCNKLD